MSPEHREKPCPAGHDVAHCVQAPRTASKYKPSTHLEDGVVSTIVTVVVVISSGDVVVSFSPVALSSGAGTGVEMMGEGVVSTVSTVVVVFSSGDGVVSGGGMMGEEVVSTIVTVVVVFSSGDVAVSFEVVSLSSGKKMGGGVVCVGKEIVVSCEVVSVERGRVVSAGEVVETVSVALSLSGRVVLSSVDVPLTEGVVSLLDWPCVCVHRSASSKVREKMNRPCRRGAPCACRIHKK